jgi:hypothetical protein
VIRLWDGLQSRQPVGGHRSVNWHGHPLPHRLSGDLVSHQEAREEEIQWVHVSRYESHGLSSCL